MASVTMNRPMRDSDERAVDFGQSERRRAFRFGLSAKLLLLTIPMVLFVQVLIYLPAIANFRSSLLNEKLARAATAVLVLDAAPTGMVPDWLAREILDSIGTRAVAVKTGNNRRLLSSNDPPELVEHVVDMRNMTIWRAVVETVHSMLETEDHVIRVIGDGPASHSNYVEVLLDEAPLREAIGRFSVSILMTGLAISLLYALFVFLVLHFLFVRPMGRLAASLGIYRKNPESVARILKPSNRSDEIGVVERELSDMQRELVTTLHHKSRLAALGLAVSKINHDLRNMLAAAQMISDQMARVPEPRVQRFAPKLVRSLERAIGLCQSTLSYGSAQEADPVRQIMRVKPLVAEVIEAVGLAHNELIELQVDVAPQLEIDADPDQLFRILINVVRNAVEALQGSACDHTADGLPPRILIVGKRNGSVASIEVADNGAGVAEYARNHLFEAFQSSARPGGNGLGLAISAELVRAHGGDIELVEGESGATFRITVPDRPIKLNTVPNFLRTG